MNATFIEPTPRSAGVPTTTRDDISRPLQIFVAFDQDDCARNAEVLIRRVAPDELCDTELLACLETLAVLSRLEFFAGRAESKAASSAEPAPRPATNFAQFTATTHAPASLRGWGINE